MKAAAFATLMTEFAAAGGGVLLMPEEQNIKLQRLFSTTEAFGIKLPLNLLTETNSNLTTRMMHMQVMTRCGNDPSHSFIHTHVQPQPPMHSVGFTFDLIVWICSLHPLYILSADDDPGCVCIGPLVHRPIHTIATDRLMSTRDTTLLFECTRCRSR